ncbi:MAG TPA: DUF2846 domain-containing protein [Burkholderiales bacterium]|nr:DUF2846 domain-containing protein [Burkholderiales bacterium]
MRSVKTFICSALLLAVASCATVQSLVGGGPGFPPVEAGKGRVYFYRTGTIGSTFKIDTSIVMINGDKVGKFIRPGVYLKDLPPGSYAVTTTMTAKVVFFRLEAGEKKYVKFDNDIFGSILRPELIDPKKGESDVSGMDRLVQ